jgi:hypothetical protein
MEIKLDPGSIQGIVEQAILSQLSAEQREKVLAQAVTALMTPQESSMGYRKTSTPLQEAFDTAVRQVAATEVRKIIEEDSEARQKILELVGVSIAEVCKGNYDGLPERIGEAIGGQVSQWLQDRGYK